MFNPTYDQGVKTDIDREFLKIIDRCFPSTHKLHNILNKKHGKNIIHFYAKCEIETRARNREKMQLPKKKHRVPAGRRMLRKRNDNQATVKCEGKEEMYVGLTATDFKDRLANHKSSFKTKSESSATELSKYVWQLKEKNLNYSMKWNISSRAPQTQYNNKAKRCNLCLAEKYYI